MKIFMKEIFFIRWIGRVTVAQLVILDIVIGWLEVLARKGKEGKLISRIPQIFFHTHHVK